MVTSSKHASLGSYLLALQVITLACVWHSRKSHRHTVTGECRDNLPLLHPAEQPWIKSLCISSVYIMEEADSAPDNDPGLLLAGPSASPGKPISDHSYTVHKYWFDV